MNMLASVLMLADSGEGPPAGFLAVFGLLFCGIFVVAIAIQALICYLIISLFKRVPEEHRKQNPNMVWLLLIPCFNLVWVWFVYPKLSQSYESWAKAVGRADVGNAYGGLAMALCIAVDCSVVPLLNYLAGPVALVLMIVFLVMISGLKDKLAAPAA